MHSSASTEKNRMDVTAGISLKKTVWIFADALTSVGAWVIMHRAPKHVM